MTDARKEYEDAIDDAFNDLANNLADAYRRYEKYSADAWYNYQVRTGMVTVPKPEGESEDGRSDIDQGEDAGDAGSDSVREDAGEAPGRTGDGDTGDEIPGTTDTPTAESAG